MMQGRTVLIAILSFILILGLCTLAFGTDQPTYKVGERSFDTMEEAEAFRFEQQKADKKQALLEEEIALEARKTAMLAEQERIFDTRLLSKSGEKVAFQSHPTNKRNPESIFLFEDFQGQTFPPTSWDTINTDPGYGWFLGNYNSLAALVDWHGVGYLQDEWLLTPDVDVSGSSGGLVLEFWMLQGYNYPHIFKVHLSEDGGTSWVEIFDSEGTGYPEFEWYLVTVDLSGYSGKGNIMIGFQYVGEDADLFGIDDVSINDNAPGRCCYGDPQDPDCLDETADACASLGGTWDGTLSCIIDPCPISNPPANDDCAAAEAITDGSYPFDTEQATADGAGYTYGPNIWYCYTATCTGTATASLCGSGYDTKIAAFDGCTCDPLGALLNSSDDACFGKAMQSEIEFSVVSGQTYLIEVGGFSVIAGQGTLVMSCVEGPVNDNCANATSVVGSVTDMPFSTTGATHDGPGDHNIIGKNIWYCYFAPCDGEVTVSLCGTDFDTKLVAYEGCVCEPIGTEVAYNDDGCSGYPTGDPWASEITFTATSGTQYLIQVAGYQMEEGDGLLTISCDGGAPTGRCCYGDPVNCADNTLAVCLGLGGTWNGILDCTTPCPTVTPGDNCSDPITNINFPGDLPWSDLNQYTCGRSNDYTSPNLCHTSYGEGEEIVYSFDVDVPTTIEITIDPKESDWTYCQITEECPPVIETCVYYFRNIAASVYTSDPIELPVGTYYMIVDTWPIPWCIPDFDINIVEVAGPYVCGDANGDGSTNLADAGFIINYIFYGGAPPSPMEAGDANADDSVNLADAGYIVNYIFYGGLPPMCP